MTTSSSYVSFKCNYNAVVAKAIDKMNKLRLLCYSHYSAARDANSLSYHLMTQCNKPKPADLKQALRQVLTGRYDKNQLDRMVQLMMARAKILRGPRPRIDNRKTISDRISSSSSSSGSMKNSRTMTQSSDEYSSNPPIYIPISPQHHIIHHQPTRYS
jgi:hypothetical protein